MSQTQREVIEALKAQAEKTRSVTVTVGGMAVTATRPSAEEAIAMADKIATGGKSAGLLSMVACIDGLETVDDAYYLLVLPGGQKLVRACTQLVVGDLGKAAGDALDPTEPSPTG